MLRLTLGIALAAGMPSAGIARQAPPVLSAKPGTMATPPKAWIDATTGHRIVHISDDPGSSSPYFNVNSYTPHGRWMRIVRRAGSWRSTSTASGRS